jgi:hypothetical protein
MTLTHQPPACIKPERREAVLIEAYPKSTSYHKPGKMQFDHCNIAKTAELSLSLTASAYFNVQSNQKVVDDS